MSAADGTREIPVQPKQDTKPKRNEGPTWLGSVAFVTGQWLGVVALVLAVLAAIGGILAGAAWVFSTSFASVIWNLIGLGLALFFGTTIIFIPFYNQVARRMGRPEIENINL